MYLYPESVMTLILIRLVITVVECTRQSFDKCITNAITHG